MVSRRKPKPCRKVMRRRLLGLLHVVSPSMVARCCPFCVDGCDWWRETLSEVRW